MRAGKPTAWWISPSGEPNTANVTVTQSTHANLLHYAVTLRQNGQVCTRPKR